MKHPLAKTIHTILKERHGEPYASDKVAPLTKMDAGQILAWATFELDQQNQSAMFKALGVDQSREYTPASALRRIVDAANRLGRG